MGRRPTLESRPISIGICLAMLSAILACAPGVAAARKPGARIVVSGGQAHAVIERHPFNLRIEDSRGHRVLREVKGGARPLETPSTIDPVAPGLDSRNAPTLYAPLSFLAGGESLTQYDGGFFGGNLLSGRRTGVQYSAVAVRRVKREGRGVRLVVSTDDPSGASWWSG